MRTNLDFEGKEIPLDERKDSVGDLQDQCKAKQLIYSTKAQFIFVGCDDGTLRIHHNKTGKLVTKMRPTLEEISDIKCSPNG